MPTAQLFVPVWPAAGVAHRRDDPASKRRRLQTDADNIDSDDSISDGGVDISDFSADQIQQYQVAGQDTTRRRPASPFPHAAATTAASRRQGGPARKDLAASDLRDIKDVSLQKRHLAVMTAVMHRSLLEGDFMRAGRAWGMLLRTRYDGSLPDLRHHDIWTIGAEILLRRSATAPDTDGAPDVPASNDTVIEDQAFQAAKTYFEQLILQYPYQRGTPDSVSSLSFYPVYFGLWIYEATSKSSVALGSSDRSPPRKGSLDGLADHDDRSAGSSEIESDDEHDVAEVKRAELRSAEQIAVKMDEILISPPYDSYKPLLQIRAMVAVWTADLYKSILSAATETDDDDDDSEESGSPHRGTASYRDKQDEVRTLRMIQEQRHSATAFFLRLQRAGGDLPQHMKSLVNDP